jgi:hypothetical protein
MSPRLRLLLAGGLGALLAVYVGVDIANESYQLGGLALLVIGWVLLEYYSAPKPDAWALALVLLGYIVGNRGFAQFMIMPDFPLLPAEAILMVCVPALLLRLAFQQATPFASDGLNFSILAWMLCGTARLPLDLYRYGFDALRDFATVYYASFFFIAQALCRHEASRLLLRRALLYGFALLPVLSAAFSLYPDFFLTTLTWRGVPVIYYKDDLVSTFLAGGFFYFWAWREAGGSRVWLIPAAVCLLMSPTIGSPRAAMLGTALMTAAWLLAGRTRLVAFQAGSAALVLAVMLSVFLVRKQDIRETSVYSVYEHAISIFDVTGTGEYIHNETGDPGDNNRFRLTWWRTVAEQTLEGGPVFGLGFGADLASQFLIEYDMLGADFSARSPHSVIMSVFGRMGTVGLVLFLFIPAMMVRETWSAFRQRNYEAMGLWSAVWTLWMSACFGVVLEGPMGAVLFWIMLGMAHDATGRNAAAPPAGAAAAALQPAEAAGEMAASP